MAKKNKVDVISTSIVILNILIVAVLIVLVLLIYLYMTGKLENTDVSNMDQETASTAVITTTQITTVNSAPEIIISEPEPDDTEEVTETAAPESSETTEGTEQTEDTAQSEDTEQTEEVVSAVESNSYDPDFFANDMFIGDSIYTGLVNYGYFPDSQVFAEIGLNPESARTKTVGGYTAAGKAAELQPKRIFIMLGSNGLAYMGNTHMAEQLGALVDDLRAASPDSYIYVVSIPPVTKAHDAAGQETMVMVNGYNKLLRQMAEEKGVVFLDLCSKLQDASGYFSDEYAEADGLHFLGSAYKTMLSFFQRSIEL